MKTHARQDTAAIEALVGELLKLRADIVDESRAEQEKIDAAHPGNRESAVNLSHYLALRRRDLRELQDRLSMLGLSSLGRAEPHVLATIDAVLSMLHRPGGHARPQEPTASPPVGYAAGHGRLAEHADALLGSAPAERRVRIMVTMPSAAADDARLVHDLLSAGMDCIRINCAHDDAATWSRIIGHLRRAEKALGRSCLVAMDLAGPKIRTGTVEAGPEVLKVRPARDVFGRVSAPARIWLTSIKEARPEPGQYCVHVDAAWLQRLRQGDKVKLVDARGRKRTWVVTEQAPEGCWAESDRTTYVTPDTALRRSGAGAKGKGRVTRACALPAREGVIRLHKNDPLILTRDGVPGRAATVGSAGQLPIPASVGCTLSQVFEDVRPGQAIWFDDGKIGGVIDKVRPDTLDVTITQAAPGGSKLRADKGINLPDTELRLPALTDKDIADLEFIAAHADLVQFSFANSAEDVAALQRHLARTGKKEPAIVLKIETARGFRNLPAMLMTAMRSRACGVMIARGDLAVECGFERMAEVQEEILWICEAAHVPVIWATQVLESLAQKGMPSRAELSDAAMSDRAECVMLNKGPYILDALRSLDDILRRMQAHQSKKRAMLRPLQLAQRQV